MRYAIIENEAFARMHLQDIISRLRPEAALVFTCESVEESVEMLSRHRDLDLIFMDIELVDGTCFDIFESTVVSSPVIFTTAYDRYALKAFKVNSVDYILKPIMEGDVEFALSKYEASRAASPSIDYKSLLETLLPPSAAAEKAYPQRILVASGDNYSYVPVQEIAWLFSEDRYVFLYLHGGTKKMTDLTNLGKAEQMLDPKSFFRISRNIIASITAVKTTSKYFKGRLKIALSAGSIEEKVILSATKRSDFLNWLGGNI